MTATLTTSWGNRKTDDSTVLVSSSSGEDDFPSSPASRRLVLSQGRVTFFGFMRHPETGRFVGYAGVGANEVWVFRGVVGGYDT